MRTFALRRSPGRCISGRPFAEEIADGFDERYDTYKASIQDPKDVQGRWWFMMHTCKERLAAASEDVMRRVEERPEEALAAASGISLLDKDDNPFTSSVAQEKAFKLQQ